jgi:hypothetical protein
MGDSSDMEVQSLDGIDILFFFSGTGESAYLRCSLQKTYLLEVTKGGTDLSDTPSLSKIQVHNG